jgi:hypothetical protein
MGFVGARMKQVLFCFWFSFDFFNGKLMMEKKLQGEFTIFPVLHSIDFSKK